MKIVPLAVLALASLPAIAHADILVHNLDGHTWEIAVRHPHSTLMTEVPKHGFMVLSDGASTVQLQDANGNAVGSAVDVEDGDKLTVKNGKIVREKGAAATSDDPF